MKNAPKFTWLTIIAALLVLGSALGVRAWYLTACADQGRLEAAWQVQGDYPRLAVAEGVKHRERDRPTVLDQLVENIADHNYWFGCQAPLANDEEPTAHLAPGYPLLLGTLTIWQRDSSDSIMRWLQCVLGSLTAVCYFFFARRAFHSTLIGTIAGLLAAFYPFWIINTAELNDGVLTGFLLSLSLMAGTRSGQTGGPFSGLLFGLALAGLCLVRAAMLPFAIIALLWFLWRCRRFSLGWFAAILTLLGFVNGLAPWFVRNYHLCARPVPIVTTTYYHLWMGNNPRATGSTLDESALRGTLPQERLTELLNETNQAKRYDKLAHEVWQEISRHPAQTLSRRLSAALAFFFGEHWFKSNEFAVLRAESDLVADTPEELKPRMEDILTATLLALFGLALLGWRWSFAWRVSGRLGAIAALWIPLPYILSHAEVLSGPRLPYDGILLCYAAYALVRFIPGMVRDPEAVVVKAEPVPSLGRGK